MNPFEPSHNSKKLATGCVDLNLRHLAQLRYNRNEAVTQKLRYGLDTSLETNCLLCPRWFPPQLL